MALSAAYDGKYPFEITAFMVLMVLESENYNSLRLPAMTPLPKVRA